MLAKQCITLLLTFSIFVFMKEISMRFLSDVYLFEWTGRRFYLYIWVSLPFFIFVLKDFVAAWIITIGNVIGVPIGQVWGDYLIYRNMLKITPETDIEMVCRWQYHYGAFIWPSIILACFGLILGYKLFKRARRVCREIEKQYGNTGVMAVKQGRQDCE